MKKSGGEDAGTFEYKKAGASELASPFILKSPRKLSFARTFSHRDPHRIQTCNLLIRSQMLYSVELAGLVMMLFFVLYKSELLFLDASLLSGEFAEVENACTANLADLVNFD